MRSIWKGHIRFSLVTIPIQLFTAFESGSNISFKQLHKEDNGRIQYKKFCASCEEEVPYGDIVKGYEYEPDSYVVLDKEDFKNIKLKSSRAIDINAFVDIGEVHPTRFESAYFVGPNGEIAQSTYNLLVKTLQKTGKAGVGRLILRDREDVVLLVPHGNGLILYKLRYPDEVRSIKDVPDIQDVPIDEAQLQLAETLVSSLSKSFADVDFTDQYKDALMELVEDKVAGKQIVTIDEAEVDTPVVDIMAALQKSIEEAKALKKGA